MSRKFRIAFFLPFIVAIPIVIISSMQDKIIKNHGVETFNILITIMVIAIVVASFLPFISIFKKLFSGGGYSFFWGRGKLAKLILQTGTPGTATVKSIGENSGGGVMTINGQPVLNLILIINNGTNPPYEVSFDTIISRAAVPQFQPGATFPVKIDTENPQSIVLDRNATSTQNKPTVGGEDWTEMDRELIQNEGKDGMAKILKVEDTGKTKDFQPLVNVVYDVYLPGESPYKIEREIALSTIAAQKLSECINKTYKARVHPYNKERMIVDINF